ncbi:MAG: putative response regulatory protein [Herbinix sp.]|jgi:YesN/AraC family two-component response regulator|nr:putative response regulatory protein [Herbinix sp.]
MYKVIIIDDEPIIVEGLSRTIPWEKFGCQIVATAYDGMEGTEAIRKFKPNIVISDIAMPGLDGLAMVAGIKSEFPDLEISILTGYRVFDYAQKAIKLGVTRFILKPSNMEELEEAIVAMGNNLKAKNITEESHTSNEGHESSKSENAASSFIVNNAIGYIEKNYARKLTLSDVAEKTYVSQWHLSKLLNLHTGQNFSEILNDIRIREAKELLKNPSLRIGDVAEMVGYVDMAHFSRMFKKILGIPATEYRNTVSAKEIE